MNFHSFSLITKKAMK
jgi:hypothetical protein